MRPRLLTVPAMAIGAGAVIWASFGIGAPLLTTGPDHRVGAPSMTGPPPALRASDPPRARLAIVGDVGTGDAHARRTGRTVARRGGVRGFDALLLLGDNVYPRGDASRLGATVFQPFRKTLRRGARIVATLGNHDVLDGNGPRQLRALGSPAEWYRRRVGPVEILVLDSNRPDDARQRRWLARATRAPRRAPWRIAIMHHPLYSAGAHGSSRNVRTAFGGMLEAGGVDLVLAGHDHDYQRSVPIRGVVHVVSGGAARLRASGREEFTAFSASTRHFVEVNVWRDRLRLTAIDHNGRAFDDHLLRRPERTRR